MLTCFSSQSPKKSPDTVDGSSRQCTDVPALLVFILFVVGAIFVSAFALFEGNGWRLFYGTDSFGNVCGVENAKLYGRNLSGLDLRNKRFALPMDVDRIATTVWICVSACPNVTLHSRAALIRHGDTLCRYDVPRRMYDDELAIPSTSLGPCPIVPVYASRNVLGRCIPLAASEIDDDSFGLVYEFLNSLDAAHKYLGDVVGAYREIVFLCCLAFVLSLIAVFVFQFFAANILRLVVSTCILFCIAITVALFVAFAQLHFKLSGVLSGAVDDGDNLTLVAAADRRTPPLDVDLMNKQALFLYALIAIGALVACGALAWYMTASFKHVTGLFVQAGKFINRAPVVLFLPFFTFGILISIFAFWMVVLVMLTSAVYLSAEEYSSESATVFNFIHLQYGPNSHPIRYFWWFHLAGLVWVAEFVLACQQLVVSGAVAMWYFSKEKCGAGLLVCGSFRKVVLCHLGSAALGSLIISLVKIPRMLLMFWSMVFRNRKFCCPKSCASPCLSCLKCMEKSLLYFHHNAYAIVVMESRNFCGASVQAFTTIVANPWKVAAINCVGGCIMFMAKLAVTAVMVFIAAMVFQFGGNYHFWAMPLLIVTGFTYFTVHCFMSIFEIILDTLFLCYAEDRYIRDVTDGAAELPNAKSFKKFLDKSAGPADFSERNPFIRLQLNEQSVELGESMELDTVDKKSKKIIVSEASPKIPTNTIPKWKRFLGTKGMKKHPTISMDSEEPSTSGIQNIRQGQMTDPRDNRPGGREESAPLLDKSTDIVSDKKEANVLPQDVNSCSPLKQAVGGRGGGDEITIDIDENSGLISDRQQPNLNLDQPIISSDTVPDSAPSQIVQEIDNQKPQDKQGLSLTDFDHSAQPTTSMEIPISEITLENNGFEPPITTTVLPPSPPPVFAKPLLDEIMETLPPTKSAILHSTPVTKLAYETAEPFIPKPKPSPVISSEGAVSKNVLLPEIKIEMFPQKDDSFPPQVSSSGDVSAAVRPKTLPLISPPKPIRQSKPTLIEKNQEKPSSDTELFGTPEMPLTQPEHPLAEDSGEVVGIPLGRMRRLPDLDIEGEDAIDGSSTSPKTQPLLGKQLSKRKAVEPLSTSEKGKGLKLGFWNRPKRPVELQKEAKSQVSAPGAVAGPTLKQNEKDLEKHTPQSDPKPGDQPHAGTESTPKGLAGGLAKWFKKPKKAQMPGDPLPSPAGIISMKSVPTTELERKKGSEGSSVPELKEARVKLARKSPQIADKSEKDDDTAISVQPTRRTFSLDEENDDVPFIDN